MGPVLSEQRILALAATVVVSKQEDIDSKIFAITQIKDASFLVVKISQHLMHFG